MPGDTFTAPMGDRVHTTALPERRFHAPQGLLDLGFLASVQASHSWKCGFRDLWASAALPLGDSHPSAQ